MHRSKVLILLTALLGLLLPAGLFAQQDAAKDAPGREAKPFLWRIETDPPSYLFGTAHIPDRRILDLPQVVKDAVAASDELYTEIPMDMVSQLAMAPKMMLPGDQTLKDILPKETYDRADAILKKKGMGGIGALNKTKVWALAATMMTIDMMKDMAKYQVLDMYLSTEAALAGKKTGAVETVEEQLGVFESMTIDEQIKMLNDSMDAMEKAEKEGTNQREILVKHYLAGDVDAMYADLMKEYGSADSEEMKKFEKVFIVDRDIKMADRIHAMLEKKDGKARFFAFGAAHFRTGKGVGHLLEQKGYKVTRLTAADKIEVPEDKKAKLPFQKPLPK